MRQRVNPRVNRDLPPKAMAEPPPRNERAEELALLFASPGWVDVCLPALRARLQQIERRLAIDRNLQIDELRRSQAQHELLSEMVASPREFFTRPAPSL